MKKIFRFIAVAATVAAAASCAKEIAPVEGAEDQFVPYTFEASLPETKAALNGFEVTWQEGDKIALYDNKHTKCEFTLIGGAGTKSAKFYGTITEGFTGFYAVYPYSAAGEKGAITVPAEQNITAGTTADPAALIMTFGSKSSVKSNKLKTIEFTNACGIARMTVPTGATSATLSATGACYTANFPAAASDGTTVDIVLPVATYKDILVALTTTEGSFVKTSANPMAISAGKVLKLGDVKGTPAAVIRSGAELKSFLESPAKTDAYVIKDLDLTGIALPDTATVSGVFNGLGCSIKNATLKAPIFDTNNGTIKNVVLDKSCTTAPDSAIFAALVETNAGTLENVINNSDVKFEANDTVRTGALFAALAVYNTGKISSCRNNGDVSYIVNSASAGWGVASICAVNGGQVTDCVNEGKVVSYADYCCDKKAVGKLTFAIVGCTGGIAAYGLEGGTVTSCTNNGDIDYLVRAMNRYTGETKMNRNNVSGIVAAPNGDIVSCVNNGTVKAYCRNDEGTVNSIEYLLCVGGISGGDYFATNQSTTNIRQCVNNGRIDAFSEHSGSNNVVSGIVAWPGNEDASSVEGCQKNKTVDCKNHGDINVSGTLKCRVGGIQGGTGNMEGCSNDGNITLASTVNTASVAASLCGFHSKAHTIVNCEAYGSVKTEAALGSCGGLIGAHGNAKTATGAGCKVNCEIACPNVANIGLVIGSYGGTAKITMGTVESPIKVAGKVNGVEITAENFASYLHGAANFDASKHVINASFNDDPVLAYGGKVYKIVKLKDGKWWMAENLRYVPEGYTVSSDPADKTSKVFYSYTSDGTVCTPTEDATRGYLYSYDLLLGFDTFDNDALAAKFTDAKIAADPTLAQGICPNGWHIPSAAEYKALCGQGNSPYNVVDTTAAFWDSSLSTAMATVLKAEALKWNFSFPGCVLNNAYNKTIITSDKTADASLIGKLAMNYYPSSTYHNFASNQFKFWAMMSSFTSTNNNGKLSIADCISYNSSTKAFAAVPARCVKNE